MCAEEVAAAEADTLPEWPQGQAWALEDGTQVESVCSQWDGTTHMLACPSSWGSVERYTDEELRARAEGGEAEERAAAADHPERQEAAEVQDASAEMLPPGYAPDDEWGLHGTPGNTYAVDLEDPDEEELLDEHGDAVGAERLAEMLNAGAFGKPGDDDPLSPDAKEAKRLAAELDKLEMKGLDDQI
eukprot:5261461-Pyramimonas_sp.AAC.1